MKKSAFTLIELSIVLVIIGLLIGGSFKILKVMRERAQISRAQDDVQVAKEATIGYVQTTDELPTVKDFNNTLSPIKNNQHQLFYTFGDDTDSNSYNICSFTKTDLNITKYKWNDDKSAEVKDKIIQDVAFVIASESKNHKMQTELKNHNVSYHAPFYKDYDDIVSWVTLSQLQEEAKCSNHPLRIVNSSLPNTDTLNSSSYNVEIVIDGNYSSPTADNCTFTNNNKFSYTNFHITNSGTTTGGTSTDVNCSVSADGKTIEKKFTINVNPSTGTGTGNRK